MNTAFVQLILMMRNLLSPRISGASFAQLIMYIIIIIDTKPLPLLLPVTIGVVIMRHRPTFAITVLFYRYHKFKSYKGGHLKKF